MFLLPLAAMLDLQGPVHAALGSLKCIKIPQNV